MKSGNNNPPHRAACGGVNFGVAVEGSIFAQKKSKYAGIARYVNNTRVPNPTGPGTTVPYSRPMASRPATGDCPGDATCDATHTPCGAWPQPFPVNTFARTGAVDMGKCLNRGRKGLMAMMPWHGKLGWQSGQYAAPQVADGTRYCQLDISFSFTKNVLDEITHLLDYTVTGSVSFILSVDRATGIVTRSGYSSSVNYSVSVPLVSQGEVNQMEVIVNDCLGLGHVAAITDLDFILLEGDESDLSGSISNTEVTASVTTPADPISHIVPYVCSLSMTLSDPNSIYEPILSAYNLIAPAQSHWDITDDALFRWMDSATANISPMMATNGSGPNSISGVSFPISHVYTANSGTDQRATGGWWSDKNGGGLQYGVMNVSGSNGDPAPAVNILGLNNSTIDTFRADPSTIAIVSGELPHGISIDALGNLTGTFTDAPSGVSTWFYFSVQCSSRYAGKILGMPMPFAQNDADSVYYQPGTPAPAGAYEGFFDFAAEIWKFCTPDPPPAVLYQDGSGDFAPSFLPQNATHWTNLKIANLGGVAFTPLPKGAFVIVSNNVVLVHKWAEVKLPWPSQNLARPCGVDRFLPTETTVCCIVGGSFPNYTVQTIGTGTHPLAGDIIVTPDGVYPVTAVTPLSGDFTVTVGAKLAALPTDYLKAYALATGIDAPDEDADMDWLGTLPYWTKAGLCGRVPVTITDVGSGTLNVKTNVPCPYLITGDHFDFLAADGSVVVSNAAITRVDDSNFTVAGSLTTYAAVLYVMVHGAADEKWNDNSSKGDYVYAVTTFTDPSGNVFTTTCTTKCLPFTNCSPSVLCISPDAEVWDNGRTEPFPAYNSFAIGPDNTIEWQADFRQVMRDLLYQTPHKNCLAVGDGKSWLSAGQQDNAFCVADDDLNDFFAYQPLVEARCDLPVGAPAPPPGIASPFPGPNSGNPLIAFDGIQYSWVVNREECACLNVLAGRFIDVYAANVIYC